MNHRASRSQREKFLKAFPSRKRFRSVDEKNRVVEGVFLGDVGSQIMAIPVDANHAEVYVCPIHGGKFAKKHVEDCERALSENEAWACKLDQVILNDGSVVEREVEISSVDERGEEGHYDANSCPECVGISHRVEDITSEVELFWEVIYEVNSAVYERLCVEACGRSWFFECHPVYEEYETGEIVVSESGLSSLFWVF